jgi:GT2 family glycosyltransferase
MVKLADPYGVSVLIVNWNGQDDLRGCLTSLAAQRDSDHEVVVVDNGSRDDSCAMLRREFPEGCNRGLAAGLRPWVFMLNNDTRLDAGALVALQTAARAAGPRLGMLQARIVLMDRPELTNSTGVLLRRDGRFVDRDFAAPLRPTDRQEEVFCVSAGAALYRREMLEAVRLPTGVFDRGFFMYYEDVDLGWRCRLAGWTAEYVPAALVYHRFQGSSSRQKRTFVASHCHANKVRTLLKNASLGYLGAALPRVLRTDVLPLFKHQRFAALAQLERRVIEKQWAE